MWFTLKKKFFFNILSFTVRITDFVMGKMSYDDKMWIQTC